MTSIKLCTLALASALFASAGFAGEEGIHRGMVSYTKTIGGYSYIKIKESGKELWVAALPIQVAVGEEVEYAGGDVMTQFHSKSMNQTFDAIRFVSRIHVVGKDVSGKTMPRDAMPKDDVHKGAGGAQAVVAPVRQGEIAKPKDGKTIGELFAEKESLKGKKVLLRAKVVKFSKNILGKNWATLADGTGKSPNDRIVAITMEALSVGDVVTAGGVLKTDVNLGAGYLYKVLLEEVKFSK
jgi:hypothetical protein